MTKAVNNNRNIYTGNLKLPNKRAIIFAEALKKLPNKNITFAESLQILAKEFLNNKKKREEKSE